MNVDDDGQAEQQGDPQERGRCPHRPDGEEKDDLGERRQRRPTDG
jgi:hypothetical protein